MQYSILIVDDDSDFNSLLTDIFEQADFMVSSTKDPLEALEAFKETDYDLVVTDFRMPEMSGSEFIREIKKVRSGVPVIMVSGYLENDTIRELISEGVGGVFLKPLNIFALLERSRELIDEAQKLQRITTKSDGANEQADSGNRLGFRFRSFSCKSGVSVAFAERLYSLRNFKSTLTLLGEPGTHFRRICEDIRELYENSREQFVYLTDQSFNEAEVLSLIDRAQKADAERITFVLLGPEAMNTTQKQLATKLARHEDPFDRLDAAVRVIFCLCADLDSLFDQELIDENLYILMGTAEVSVPALRECPADIPVMMQQLLLEIFQEKGQVTVPRLDASAAELLAQHDWSGNFQELLDVVRAIVSSNCGEDISRQVVLKALGSSREEPLEARLRSYLEAMKADYVRAATVLFGGDLPQITAMFSGELPDSWAGSK